MVQPGTGGLDTPRTNLGDATYLSRQPDFDMSQEASFQSPSKDANLLQQLRNGGKPSLRTPRGNSSRAPFTDRRNLPAGLGGGEFTPLLKSATRNSAQRYGGKENGAAAAGMRTPAFLDRIDEDMTAIPAGESSVYLGASRNTSSYLDSNTPLPVMDTTTASSAASTPLVMRRGGRGPLEEDNGNNNQLSLREQEQVIDRIEKENFGLKLKIHFLEEALRKAGPGFSEAALKENTELKVDKVTMQRELQRYKKHLTSAERDLESYRQQMNEMEERVRKRHADEGHRAELERLRQAVEERDADIEDLQRRLEGDGDQQERIEKLQDDVGDLEADVREKDRAITERDDELEELRARVLDAEDQLKDAQRKMLGLEEQAQTSEELEEAKDTIADLEAANRRLQQSFDEMEEKLQDAAAQRDRAEADLEELQEEMADKSMVTKGLSRQVEEKVVRLQDEVERARQECLSLEKAQEAHQKDNDALNAKVKGLSQERDASERIRQSLATKLEETQADLRSREDEKALLQTRHDALTAESAGLQREVASLQKTVMDLQDDLQRERQHALDIERDIRSQSKGELDRLHDEISDLQAEIRAKDNLYDNDSEKWEAARDGLEAERDRAEERAAGLQRTVDKLREAEGALLADKDARLHEAAQSEAERHRGEEAVLSRQIDDLQQKLEARQAMLEDLRAELATVRDELRQNQVDSQAQMEKAAALEDEVEVLQATLDEETENAQSAAEKSTREREALERELKLLRETAGSVSTGENAAAAARLKFQLADATEKLAAVTKEKLFMRENQAALEADLAMVQSSLADTKAERDEIREQLLNSRTQHVSDDDTFRLQQERIDLRSSRARLDNEVRRLRDENKLLAEQRLTMEKSMDDQMDLAVAEEDRLNQEIIQLQAKLRQQELSSSEGRDVVALRRTIRDLERRIADYETQLAAAAAGNPLSNNNNNNNQGEVANNSELSLIRKDLSATRRKEIELLQREAAHKDTVKALKKQIADLERKAHEAELTRLIGPSSPSSFGGSAQKAEVNELRHQLSTASQAAHELKKSLRDAERASTRAARDLQARLDDAEEQKAALEHALADAQATAKEAAADYQDMLAKHKAKMDRYRREREELAASLRDTGARRHLHQQDHTDDSTSSEIVMGKDERRDLHAMLRASQLDAARLDSELQSQRAAVEELAGVEVGLRKKLERARSERAAYRASAERLQRDVKRLDKVAKKAEEEAAAAAAEMEEQQQALVRRGRSGDVDTDAIIRAAEEAQHRHVKEIRGMSMQLDVLSAQLDRETQLRADAAYAKRYLLLELQVRDACNKADLAMIDDIAKHLKVPGKPALRTTMRELNQKREAAAARARAQPALALKRAATAVRFIVRMQRGARAWSKTDKVRRLIVGRAEEMQREARLGRVRDEWRASGSGSGGGGGRVVVVAGAAGR